jgi:hypothetical protein
MVGNASRERRRSVWKTTPGARQEDAALLAAWYEAHPAGLWRGQDGRGGFIGWANRLDERVASRGILMSPRAEVIPIGQREVYRESFRLVATWRFLLVLAVTIAAAVLISPSIAAPVIGVYLGSHAAARIRSRRREAMRAELTALGKSSYVSSPHEG